MVRMDGKDSSITCTISIECWYRCGFDSAYTSFWTFILFNYLSFGCFSRYFQPFRFQGEEKKSQILF